MLSTLVTKGTAPTISNWMDTIHVPFICTKMYVLFVCYTVASGGERHIQILLDSYLYDNDDLYYKCL